MRTIKTATVSRSITLTLVHDGSDYQILKSFKGVYDNKQHLTVDTSRFNNDVYAVDQFKNEVYRLKASMSRMAGK